MQYVAKPEKRVPGNSQHRVGRTEADPLPEQRKPALLL